MRSGGSCVKLALITDAWLPQVNGVVTTLVELVRELELRGHQVEVIHPGLFATRPCPGYAGISLAVRPFRVLKQLLGTMAPDAIHLATEGPLGWAGRRFCLQQKLSFTTAYHTRFPELLHAALKVPLWLSYAVFRAFHKKSSAVMVPTPSVLKLLEAKGFKNLRNWTHGVDMQLFNYHGVATLCDSLGVLSRPITLFVGRVSYEKNIEAFLKLDVPGTKVVCGVGPLESGLKERFPNVRWLGILKRAELAKVYASADVFVMPSLNETFGLVMLEAMACGTPVAAYPVEGPLEVLGSPQRGGALEEDLSMAWRRAIAVPRYEARSRAENFSWATASDLFIGYLVSARSSVVQIAKNMTECSVTQLSSKL
jgi:glycosyltransferase involved in cell wall biosynthesis